MSYGWLDNPGQIYQLVVGNKSAILTDKEKLEFAIEPLGGSLRPYTHFAVIYKPLVAGASDKEERAYYAHSSNPCGNRCSICRLGLVGHRAVLCAAIGRGLESDPQGQRHRR